MLQGKIDAFIQQERRLKGAIAGVHIISAETGEPLYNHLGDIRLHPASNMKLLTGAATLETLGEKYTFKTSVAYDGIIDQGVLEGNIYIKGEGDPTLLPEDITAFARSIRSAGITKIKGNIYVDDFHYDDVRLSPDLIWSDQPYYYASQISALTVSPNEDYDTSTVCLTIEPGEVVGEQPMIKSYPQTSYVDIESRVVTGEEQKEPLEESAIDIDRLHGTNHIIVSGSIPCNGEPEKIWVSVWEPSLYVGTLCKEALDQIDVPIQGNVKRKEMRETSTILHVKHSPSLKEIMVPFMKLSNNGHGEMFVKEMGKTIQGRGGWEEGIAVLNKQLQSLGVNVDGIDIRDGSGLSSATTVSAEIFTSFLYKIQSSSWFESFVHSLPVSGEKNRMVGGTLSERLYGLDVRAKTGTIYGVSTLSGYMTTNSGEKRIFSILLNNVHEKDDETIKEVEDAIVSILADDK